MGVDIMEVDMGARIEAIPMFIPITDRLITDIRIFVRTLRR